MGSLDNAFFRLSKNVKVVINVHIDSNHTEINTVLDRRYNAQSGGTTRIKCVIHRQQSKINAALQPLSLVFSLLYIRILISLLCLNSLEMISWPILSYAIACFLSTGYLRA